MVRFENVSLHYDDGPDVLTDVNFHLPVGSFHFLTGASGAGKSSLLAVMALARRPSRGNVSVFGQDIGALRRRALPPLRRRIGIVFQTCRLLDHLSVLDNVALPLRLAGQDETVTQAQARELLAWIGLGDHMAAKPPTLSGGQQQRLAIARAVIGRPELLLADEPTRAVDDAMGLRLLFLLEKLNQFGTTVVVATPSEALTARFGYPRLHLEATRLTLRRPPPARGA